MRKLKLFFACLLMAVLSIGNVWGDSKTFTFNTSAGLTALGITEPSSNSTATYLSSAFSVSPITITPAKNDASNSAAVWKSNTGALDLRLYKKGSGGSKGSSITISVSGDNKLTGISGLWSSNVTASTGTLSSGSWSPTTNTTTTEVEIYNSGSSTASGCTVITVSYESTSGGGQTPTCTAPATALSITNANAVTLGSTLELTTSGGNGGSITWSVAAGTGAATLDGNVLTPTKKGKVTITATQEVNDGKCGAAPTKEITISKPAPTPIDGTVVDEITVSTTGVTSGSYTAFTGKSATNTGHSAAVYAGKIIRGGTSGAYTIQMNTIGTSNAGREIVSTTSGGNVKRVEIIWGGTNTADRKVTIYGSNDAYTGSETAAIGTKLGEITYATNDVSDYIDVEGSYKYVQLVVSGAMYISQINITWLPIKSAITIDDDVENGSVGVSGIADLSQVAAGTQVTLTNTPASGYKLTAYDVYKTGASATKVTVTNGKFTMPDYDVTVSASFEATKTLSSITLSGEYPTVFLTGAIFSHEGMTVTANYDDASQADVTEDATFTGYNMSSASAQTVTVSYTEGTTKTQTYDITVKDAYTVTEILPMVPALNQGSLTTRVKGYISQIDSYNSTYNSITYWISVDGKTTSDQLEVYSGKNVGNTNFSAITDLAVGDFVTIAGDVKTHTNGQKEFDKNNYIITGGRIQKGAVTNVVVSGTPTKTVYANNEAFEPAGLVVTATYANGFSAVVTEGITWSADPSTITASGTVNVTATLGEQTSAEYPVLVTKSAATLSSIATNPNPASYTIYTGEALPEPVIMATYSEGDPADVSEEATYDSENVFDTETPGEQEITVSYTFGGATKTTTYTVTVVDYANADDAPYTVAEALNIITKAIGNANSAREIVVAGTVSEEKISGSNNRYKISDGTNELLVYGGKGFGGANFTATNYPKVGDVVIVKGKVINYQGNTPEFVSGQSRLLSQIRPATIAIEDVTGFEVGADDLSVTAVTASDGDITFSSGNEAVVTIVGGKLHAVGAGVATITADLAATAHDGDLNYAAASTTFSVTVLPNPETLISAIGGKFIINQYGDTAVFSRGNLQYQQSTNTWRCAENQYEWKGTENLQMGNATYDGWVDLFCWSIGVDNNYGATSAYNTLLYFNRDFVDWGGLFSGNWSTLSINEWYYMLYTRAGADDRWGMAMIGDTLGMILLPEGWEAPNGVTFVAGAMPTTKLFEASDCLDPTHADEDHWRIDPNNMPNNKFSIAEWEILEASGAVFFPYGGRRSGGYGNHTNRQDQTVDDEYAYTYYENYYGSYWTSTIAKPAEGKAYWLPLICGGCDANHENWGRGSHGWWENGRYGHAVRLVTRIPRQYTVTYDANGATGEVPVDENKYLAGAEITVLGQGTLKKEHYKFIGWKLAETTYEEDDVVATPLSANDVVFVAQWEELPVWAYTYTSNVTLSTTGGTQASTAIVKFNGESTEYDALKAGSSGTAGVLKVTVPAKTEKLHFHAYGWKGESVQLTVTASSGVTVDPSDAFAINANTGISNSSPFTFDATADPENDAYYAVSLSGNDDAEATLTISATSGKRFVLFGVNQEGGLIPVLDRIEVTGDLTTKSGYKTGDDLDLDGLKVEAIYTLGGVEQTPVDITDKLGDGLTLTYDPLVVDQTEVTITATYEDKSDNIVITLDEAVVSGEPEILTDVNSRSWTSVNQYTTPAAKTVTVTLKNVAAATATLEGDDVFSIDKTDLVNGDIITISVINTEAAGDFAATITISDNATENPAVDKVVNLSLKVVEAELPETPVSTTSEWVPATEIVDGMTVLITGVKSDVTYAMGATSSNGNNRTSVAGSLSEGIFTPGENTMPFTLVATGAEDTYYIKTTTDKYLYNASTSGNSYLKTKEEQENVSWTITLDDDGNAVITSVENTNRQIMRFNLNGTSNPLFNCYESGQQTIKIYVPYVAPEPEPQYTDIRTGLTAGNYYTLCYPKAMTAIQGGTLWSFAGRDANMAYIVKEEAPFVAGRPYLIYAESDKLEAVLEGDDASAGSYNGLYGTLEYMSNADLAGAGATYMLKNNELRPIGEGYLSAQRAYVILSEIPGGAPAPAPGRQVRKMPLQQEVATGMDDIQPSEISIQKVMINGELFILRGEKMFDATGRLVK